MSPDQKKQRTITVTLSGLQVDALRAYSDITEPAPCFMDHKHGDFSQCDGYAPKFKKAVYRGFEAIFDAWEEAGRG